MCECVCVCVCARARACVSLCVRMRERKRACAVCDNLRGGSRGWEGGGGVVKCFCILILGAGMTGMLFLRDLLLLYTAIIVLVHPNLSPEYHFFRILH